MAPSKRQFGIGAELRRVIAESEVSGKDLARAARVQASSLSRFKLGTAGLSLDAMERVCKVLGVEVRMTVPAKSTKRKATP